MITLARAVFHQKVVRQAVDKASMTYLRRAGAYVRKIARDFVKHRKNPDVHSLPYHSPYDHFGLKQSIIFGVEDKTALIGPRYIKGGLANVARLHEFGGKQLIDDFDHKLWNEVRIGDEAPVTSAYIHKKDTIIRRNERSDPKTGRPVMWIKIRTKSQAEHSRRVYRRIAPLTQRKVLARYAPRPYMNPALEKSRQYLPQLWKNSVKS